MVGECCRSVMRDVRKVAICHSTREVGGTATRHVRGVNSVVYMARFHIDMIFGNC
jgi:hypothetical protein